MKVAINACFGGFSLSKAAVLWMAAKGNEAAQKEVADHEAMVAKHGCPTFPKSGDSEFWEKSGAKAWAEGDTKRLMAYSWHPRSIDHGEMDRHDPLLIECIEALGEQANGSCARLEIIEIPDGTDYEIAEYDGNEHIAEKHRTWG